jgi:hypothetical protein
VSGIAWRLHHHAREIDIRRPAAFGGKRAADRVNARQDGGKQVLGRGFFGGFFSHGAAA